MDESLEMSLMEFAFGEVTEAGRRIFETLGREYRSGEVIFSEGSDGTDLIMILSGEVAISRTDDRGRSVLLARLGPGEILGEMSHFDDLPRSATATAACDGVRLLVFSRDDFSLVFQLHPKWTTALVEGLCGRIRSTLLSMAGGGVSS